MIDDTFKKSFKSRSRLARSDVPRPVFPLTLFFSVTLFLHLLPRPDSCLISCERHKSIPRSAGSSASNVSVTG